MRSQWQTRGKQLGCLGRPPSSLTMFAVHKQTHPPTTVEHCVCARFVSPAEDNLIIAKNTLLEVYRLKPRPPKQVTEEKSSGMGDAFFPRAIGWNRMTCFAGLCC